MISIREKLDKLPDDVKQRLIYALHAGISHVEKMTSGEFVAVHVNASNPHIRIEASTGDWSYGRMAK